MSRHKANVYSPEVIKGFKIHFVKFEETCRQAVAGIRSDSHRVMQWLRHDQLRYWKNEFRKSEDLVHRARSAYLMARFATPSFRKTSYVDELKALRKAERRKETAEKKLELMKKWTAILEQQAEKLMGPVDSLGIALDVDAPRAKARLDHMIVSLEAYLRETGVPVSSIASLEPKVSEGATLNPDPGLQTHDSTPSEGQHGNPA